MQAGFALTAPNPGKDPPDEDEREPFNIGTQIKIEPELVRLPALKGAFDVTVVVQTTVGEDSTETEQSPAEPAGAPPGPAWFVRLARWVILYRDKVRAGADHRYTACSLHWARVIPTSGDGTFRRPRRTRWPVYVGNSKRLKGKTVIVHGHSRMRYRFHGSFH